CAACHGEKLQGIATAGAAALVGGRGTLATPKPVKTVESYWPYATTLYDYVWRAMPFSDPGSLTPDEVYAVTAFILAKGGVIPEDATLDAKSLPKVEMPNARNFYDGRGPELESYRHAERR
ncbi:c-type cytochrome, partial [Hansschlegelia sp. KR7-227]|uniref:c-type cytochrome n=1 Tax=Hansschlegelia sp. KR7-227 TaxID=3400914 RepID=UPI003C096385